MLMRPAAHFTSERASARSIDPSGNLVVRERVIETGNWTIAIPAIATISIDRGRKFAPRLLLVGLAFVCVAAAAANFVFALVPGALAILAGSGVVAAALCLGSIRFDDTYQLALTANDGSRCCVSTATRGELDAIRTFLTDKINRQDCGARRVFRLDGTLVAVGEPSILAPERAHDDLMAIAERAGTAAAAMPFVEPITLDAHPVGALPPLVAVPQADPDREIDYGSVLSQITDLHRYYERHPEAAHIHARLSELELLMRSGTPSALQKARVRELAIDLATILASYPAMTGLFNHIVQLVPG